MKFEKYKVENRIATPLCPVFKGLSTMGESRKIFEFNEFIKTNTYLTDLEPGTYNKDDVKLSVYQYNKWCDINDNEIQHAKDCGYSILLVLNQELESINKIKTAYSLFHKLWGESHDKIYIKDNWSELYVLLMEIINKKPFKF